MVLPIILNETLFLVNVKTLWTLVPADNIHVILDITSYVLHKVIKSMGVKVPKQDLLARKMIIQLYTLRKKDIQLQHFQ